LNGDVPKLENVVSKQNFDGIDDSVSTGVETKFVGDLAVSKVGSEW
jgi:hypothetical protein